MRATRMSKAPVSLRTSACLMKTSIKETLHWEVKRKPLWPGHGRGFGLEKPCRCKHRLGSKGLPARKEAQYKGLRCSLM